MRGRWKTREYKAFFKPHSAAGNAIFTGKYVQRQPPYAEQLERLRRCNQTASLLPKCQWNYKGETLNLIMYLPALAIFFVGFHFLGWWSIIASTSLQGYYNRIKTISETLYLGRNNICEKKRNPRFWPKVGDVLVVLHKSSKYWQTWSNQQPETVFSSFLH